MATQSRTANRTNMRKKKPDRKRLPWRDVLRLLPVYVTLGLALLVVSPSLGPLASGMLGGAAHAVGALIEGVQRFFAPGEIAPLFTREVARWRGEIVRWAEAYELDPNLLATVMQIESCGHPTVVSVAGAQGLFQVMPFHFAPGEMMQDPETNARRGAAFLRECQTWASGDAGRAMACYNGGPGVLSRDYSSWPTETQRYYQWGRGIYADAQRNARSSETLASWLEAGGSRLCAMAAAQLGL